MNTYIRGILVWATAAVLLVGCRSAKADGELPPWFDSDLGDFIDEVKPVPVPPPSDEPGTPTEQELTDGVQYTPIDAYRTSFHSAGLIRAEVQLMSRRQVGNGFTTRVSLRFHDESVVPPGSVLETESSDGLERWVVYMPYASYSDVVRSIQERELEWYVLNSAFFYLVERRPTKLDRLSEARSER